MPDDSPIFFELRIGVTGHRQLTDPTAIRHAVDTLLEHFETTFRAASEAPRGPAGSPHSILQKVDGLLCHLARLLWRKLPICPRAVAPEYQPSLRFKAISPLASGADQIVADAVLARCNSELMAITPFPVADYERDFANAEDLKTFRRLWSKATERPDPTGHCEELLKSDSESEQQRKRGLRHDGYLNAGRKTVDACEILVAIWDGEPANGNGGTGDTVAYAIERGRPVFWINANQPTGEATMIVHQNTRDVANGPLPKTVIKPIPKRAKQISPTFHQFAAYLRDPAHDLEKSKETQQKCATPLQEAATQAHLPAEILDPILDSVLPHFTRADQLAIRYQELYVFAAVGLYTLSAAAVTISVIQVLFFPHQNWLIAFEILAMLAVVALLRIGRSETWHEKWLHDRHLAEQLRTEIFTRLVEIDGQRPALANVNTPLPFYQGPDTWVREAIDSMAGEYRKPILSPQHFNAVKRFVIDAWIKDQANWHENNARKKHQAAHFSHRTGLVLFLTTLVAACMHCAGVGHSHDDHGATSWWLVGQAATALAIICPAWGAAVHAINVLRERDRIAKRSHQMAKVLHEIAQRAELAKNYDDLRREIDVVRQMMSTEILEWWISLSFRELVLPA